MYSMCTLSEQPHQHQANVGQGFIGDAKAPDYPYTAPMSDGLTDAEWRKTIVAFIIIKAVKFVKVIKSVKVVKVIKAVKVVKVIKPVKVVKPIKVV